MKFFLKICFLCLFLGCDEFPRDPDNTFKKVYKNVLRVGFSSNPPLLVAGANPQGYEADLVLAFASSIGARVQWHQDTQWDLIELLNHQQIDIAIGGFNKKSPLKKKAGFSRPYRIEKIRLAAAHGAPIPEQISEGDTVIVCDLLVAGFIKKKGGVPVIRAFFSGKERLVAGPEDVLREKGFVIAPQVIKKIEYVVAVPHGENRLLFELEKFIDSYHGFKKLFSAGGQGTRVAKAP